MSLELVLILTVLTFCKLNNVKNIFWLLFDGRKGGIVNKIEKINYDIYQSVNQ